MGERIVSGVSSSGIPKKLVTGDKNEHNTSSAPDDFINSIAKIKAISAGVIV